MNYFKVIILALSLSACSSGGGSDGGVDDNSNTAPESFEVGTGFDFEVEGIAAEPASSGDVYAVGNFVNYRGVQSIRIARINSNGSLDAGFDTYPGFDEKVNDVALANDGSGDILAGGIFTTYKSTSRTYIMRVKADGTADAGFGAGLGFNYDLLRQGVLVIAPAVDGSGDIYVGGEFTSYQGASRNGIVRLNADGSIDNGFAVGSGFNNVVYSIVPVDDGSGDIYVGGAFTSYAGNARNRILRLNADGTIDAGFDVGSGFNSTVRSIALAADGSGDIYVGGDFAVYRGNARSRIARANSDGSNDAGFSPGAGFNALVRSVVAATDGSGDIYVGGGFTIFDGNPQNRIARLNADGSIDNGFAVGSGFDAFLTDLAIATDGSGSLYACGNFQTYQSSPVNRIIRLDSSGDRN